MSVFAGWFLRFYHYILLCLLRYLYVKNMIQFARVIHPWDEWRYVKGFFI